MTQLQRLIPAGTGFNMHHQSEVRINADYPDGYGDTAPAEQPAASE